MISDPQKLLLLRQSSVNLSWPSNRLIYLRKNDPNPWWVWLQTNEYKFYSLDFRNKYNAFFIPNSFAVNPNDKGVKMYINNTTYIKANRSKKYKTRHLSLHNKRANLFKCLNRCINNSVLQIFEIILNNKNWI